MKKFKSGNNANYFKIIIFIVIFLIIFIYISIQKLNHNYSNLTKVLLNNFNNENNYDLRFITSDLDKLLNDYYFYPKNISYK